MNIEQEEAMSQEDADAMGDKYYESLALTTDELVMLADYCGKTTAMCCGHVLTPVARPDDAEPLEPGEYPPEEAWNPAEDANQRDQLVDAAAAKGIGVDVECGPLGCKAVAWVNDAPINVDAASIKQIGLAVCRAVLEVIANTKGKP